VDGEFTIKFVKVDEKNKKIWLVPANADFPRIEVTEGSDLRIWGVVTYSITKHRK
jgi:DNA polymerase V